jgi:CMP-N-acetylneuraminic acid synthetase
MKLLTLIPAKLDSKRLTEKNIRDLNGKPLFYHSIDYAKDTKYDNRIIVSTESRRVQSLLPKGVELHERSIDLCGDVEVVDVYLDIIKNINAKFDYVICLQPDNPNRSNTLDECLDYLIENNYDDLITVNNEYKRSGSVRIFKYEYLNAGLVSKRMGCIRDDATDIHTEFDLRKAEINIQKPNEYFISGC